MAIGPCRVSVLQLDTHFPRIPGDVACPQTYCRSPEILRIERVDVAHIVRPDPRLIDITPFIEAARRSKGDIITTSCGFLSPFEGIIAAAVDRPFLASSLNALPDLITHVDGRRDGQPDGHQVNIMSFDQAALTSRHLPHAAQGRVGRIFDIGQTSHLYQVISQDLADLDATRARREIVAAVDAHLTSDCALLVLECTNLPPYKEAIRAASPIQTFDILDRLETIAPGTINPAFLSPDQRLQSISVES